MCILTRLPPTYFPVPPVRPRHPHLACLYLGCLSPEAGCFVEELLPCRLINMLQGEAAGKQGDGLDLKQALTISKDVAEGLVGMQPRYAHGGEKLDAAGSGCCVVA